MRNSTGAALNGKPKVVSSRKPAGSAELLTIVLNILSDGKAEDILSIDVIGKTTIADTMVVASGRSQRHVGALADQLLQGLKHEGFKDARVEGLPLCDWVLIDAGDIVVHLFRPEVRQFYNIEKMWTAERPNNPVAV